jgi:hypothetical protein
MFCPTPTIVPRPVPQYVLDAAPVHSILSCQKKNLPFLRMKIADLTLHTKCQKSKKSPVSKEGGKNPAPPPACKQISCLKSPVSKGKT